MTNQVPTLADFKVECHRLSAFLTEYEPVHGQLEYIVFDEYACLFKMVDVGICIAAIYSEPGEPMDIDPDWIEALDDVHFNDEALVNTMDKMRSQIQPTVLRGDVPDELEDSLMAMLEL